MVDLLFVEHLIDSMYSATIKLEKAIKENRPEEISKLRTMIFHLQQNLDKVTKI